MSYTSVFGGNTIYPSDVSYLAVALDSDIELEWPLESSGELPPAARIIDVTPDVSGWSIVLPDANLTGPGQTILFNNLSGSYSFYVKDYAGNTLATIGYGEQWQLYLAATTTAAGTWRVFRYGASTASVQPSSLAGYGLTVTNSTLSQSLPVTTFSTTGLTVALSNRASAFVWTDTGAGTLNLLTAASAGNNFFVFVRNEGGGDLTIDPAGTETINNAVDLVLRPGDSATLITDGSEWFTIGLGQQAVFAFDYTSINVTGGNYTLAGSELNRIAYKFVGTLASDAHIIVPSTIQQYWVNNATTGSFNLYIETTSGTPQQVNQGAKGIYYCDGTEIVRASDPTTLSTPVVISDGGTGAVTASGARLSLGITTFADPIVTATTGASVRTTIGAAASGANSDITSITGLTTPLSVAQGGTGSTTASAARTALGLGSIATQAANSVSITGGSISGITDLAVADGGTGASTASAALVNLLPSYTSNALKVLRLNSGATDVEWATISAGSVTSVAASGGTTGMSFSGSPITSSGTLTLTGTLAVANGGTGSTTASAARTALGAAASGANTDITALDQDITITATGTIAADTLGYRGLPQSSNTTLALADAGKHIYTSSNVTIPANGTTAFPVGTTIVVTNSGSSTLTIAITTDTLRQAGTTNTGTRTLAAYGVATLVKVTSTVWYISGTIS